MLRRAACASTWKIARCDSVERADEEIARRRASLNDTRGSGHLTERRGLFAGERSRASFA
jgi:hypothetical protein